jgi:hypothetical protein
MSREDYEDEDFIEDYEELGRKRNELDSLEGKPFIWGSALGTFDKPPYNNSGAKYDFNPSEMAAGDWGVSTEYPVTTERTKTYLDYDFDTYQRIQISNTAEVADFVPDWQLWYSQDYALEQQRAKSQFNSYKKRTMADLQGKKLDVMFSYYKKTVTNILYDHVFENADYCSLNFESNLFYTDHVLLTSASWIGSRQWEYIPDDTIETNTTNAILDVYFQWLSFCYCPSNNPIGNYFMLWDASDNRCDCGFHGNNYGANNSWDNTVNPYYLMTSGDATSTLDICPA